MSAWGPIAALCVALLQPASGASLDGASTPTADDPLPPGAGFRDGGREAQRAAEARELRAAQAARSRASKRFGQTHRRLHAEAVARLLRAGATRAELRGLSLGRLHDLERRIEAAAALAAEGRAVDWRRRSLAWLVARRPQGLVAAPDAPLALQRAARAPLPRGTRLHPDDVLWPSLRPSRLVAVSWDPDGPLPPSRHARGWFAASSTEDRDLPLSPRLD